MPIETWPRWEPVKLVDGGSAEPPVSETTSEASRRPRLLEYSWGDMTAVGARSRSAGGTRLTLWHNIDRRFIAWGAAGWHICFDVLERLLAGEPIGRMVGGEAIKFGGWQRLVAEYAEQFGVEAPNWSPRTSRSDPP